MCKTCKSSSKIIAWKMSLFLQDSCMHARQVQKMSLFLQVSCKSLAVLQESCNWFLPGMGPLTLRVGVLPLYKVFPGGYRLFCTNAICSLIL